MKKNIFVSILIIIAIVLSCNTVKIKKEKDFSNYYDSNTIYDPIFGRFMCGKIKGNDSKENYIISVIDTSITDTIKGYASFTIHFQNIDSLDLYIESAELSFVLLKNNVRIFKNDNGYRYYDSLLTPEIKKFVCWKLEGDENYQYFKNSGVFVSFEIYGIKNKN